MLIINDVMSPKRNMGSFSFVSGSYGRHVLPICAAILQACGNTLKRVCLHKLFVLQNKSRVVFYVRFENLVVIKLRG